MKDAARTVSAAERSAKAAAQSEPARKKLSYLEQREWDQLESRIEEAEARLAALHLTLQDLEVASNPARLRETYASLETGQEKVNQLYTRWSELDGKIT